jgi:hypothetical protein
MQYVKVVRLQYKCAFGAAFSIGGAFSVLSICCFGLFLLSDMRVEGVFCQKAGGTSARERL